MNEIINLLIGSFVFSIIAASIGILFEKKKKEPVEESINRITKLFSDAIKFINQIQKENEKKKEEAMKLQKDIQHYKRIMKQKNLS